MSIPESSYFPHTVGTKVNYRLNTSATNLQITIGGRATGSVIIRYRPYLEAHPVLGISTIDTMHNSEFETPPDNVINLDPLQGNGVYRYTFTMSGTLLSAIQIDDSGNSGSDIWVHITQMP